MATREQASTSIRDTLDHLKQIVSGPKPPKLSESDTKANFIEKYIEALGYRGLPDITREYYVKNSQEFIDYVLRANGEPILALEAKALQVELTDKAGAQLIQYCAVEGIEWAVLTNGRDLRLYNQYLKGALEAKLILKLDLLAFNSDEEYEAIFEQLWLISKESMTTPTGIRTWMEHQQLDKAMRSLLLDSTSATVKYIRRALTEHNVQVHAEAVAQWFRTQLTTTVTPLLPMVAVQQKARVTYEPPPLTEPLKAGPQQHRPPAFTVIRWPDLFAKELLNIGDWLILKTPEGDVRAQLVDNHGHVSYAGKTMSAGTWGREVKRWSTINIYEHALVEVDGRKVPVQELRRRASSYSGFTEARQDA
jgi:predicted type IV restriction endonuclease